MRQFPWPGHVYVCECVAGVEGRTRLPTWSDTIKRRNSPDMCRLDCLISVPSYANSLISEPSLPAAVDLKVLKESRLKYDKQRTPPLRSCTFIGIGKQLVMWQMSDGKPVSQCTCYHYTYFSCYTLLVRFAITKRPGIELPLPGT